MALPLLCSQAPLHGSNTKSLFVDNMAELCDLDKEGPCRTFASMPTSMIQHNRCAG